jgi:diguanylate cyclase (GGDEF)-like protein
MLYVPYIIITIACLLSLRFNRSRVLHILFLLGLVYWSFGYYLKEGQNDFTAKVLFHAFCLFLPLNLLIVSFMRERGVFSLSGNLFLGFILLQAAVAAWVIKLERVDVLRFVSQEFVSSHLLTPVQISQLALLIMVSSFIFIMVRIFAKHSPIESVFLGVLVVIFIVCNFMRTENVFPIFISAAGLMLAVSVVQDSHNMAYKDELTGLLARRALNERMMILGWRYTIAMIDVDHFKKFNNTYGHDMGDHVLRMVGSKLKKVKGGGKPYRYGGEEFTIVFPRKSIKQVIPHLEELRKTISKYELNIRGKDRPEETKQGKKLRGKKSTRKKVLVRVSIGVAERNGRLKVPEDVIKAADKALYRAKKEGRNQLCT